MRDRVRESVRERERVRQRELPNSSDSKTGWQSAPGSDLPALMGFHARAGSVGDPEGNAAFCL